MSWFTDVGALWTWFVNQFYILLWAIYDQFIAWLPTTITDQVATYQTAFTTATTTVHTIDYFLPTTALFVLMSTTFVTCMTIRGVRFIAGYIPGING